MTAGPSPTATGQGPDARAERLLHEVTASLDDDQAEDLVVIGLSGKSVIADFMVIASGRSQRHVSAMAYKLVERLKGAGYRDLSMEGAGRSDWVLIDAGDVVVHLFRPEVREFYGLEKMWGLDVPGDDASTRSANTP